MRKLLAPAIVFAAIAMCLLAAACKGGEGGPPQKGRRLEYPVETEEVKGRRIEYVVYAVGSLEAFEEVYVIARVQGIVRDVLFKEGDVIKFERNAKDEVIERPVLVQLDDERYVNARNTAKAELEKAEAQKNEAFDALDRRERANKLRPNTYSEEEIKNFRAKFAIAEAEASGAKSRWEKAQLDVDDTAIRAPVEGVIQSRTVRTNQQLQPGAVVATLVRRDPLLLRMSVPEQDAARIKKDMIARFTLRDSAAEHYAKLIHVKAQADSRTRMVEIVAEVQGDTSGLKPGAFAQVRIPIGSNENAPSIPQTAVRPSDRGFLAFVVAGNTAKERVLKLGLRTADGRVEVLDGVKIGERVVIRGAEALRDGATVKDSGTGATNAPVKDGGKEKGN